MSQLLSPLAFLTSPRPNGRFVRFTTPELQWLWFRIVYDDDECEYARESGSIQDDLRREIEQELDRRGVRQA